MEIRLTLEYLLRIDSSKEIIDIINQYNAGEISFYEGRTQAFMFLEEKWKSKELYYKN